MAYKPFKIRSDSYYHADADANFWFVMVYFPERPGVGVGVRLDRSGSPDPDELSKAFRQLADKIDALTRLRDAG